jgi:hypothetical protein
LEKYQNEVRSEIKGEKDTLSRTMEEMGYQFKRYRNK